MRVCVILTQKCGTRRGLIKSTQCGIKKNRHIKFIRLDVGALSVKATFKQLA